MTVTTGMDYELYGTPGGFPVLLHYGGVGSTVVSQAWDMAARAQGIELISIARVGCAATWNELVAPVLDELTIERYGVWGVADGAPYAFALASLDAERVAGVAITSGLGPDREAIAHRRPWGFDLAAITAPVRIWHSVADELVPYPTAQWMREQIPGAILQNQKAPEHAPSRDTIRAAMVFLSLRLQHPARRESRHQDGCHGSRHVCSDRRPNGVHVRGRRARPADHTADRAHALD